MMFNKGTVSKMIDLSREVTDNFFGVSFSEVNHGSTKVRKFSHQCSPVAKIQGTAQPPSPLAARCGAAVAVPKERGPITEVPMVDDGCIVTVVGS